MFLEDRMSNKIPKNQFSEGRISTKIIQNSSELFSYDGQQVAVEGRYRSVSLPIRGKTTVNSPKNLAVILLDDDSEVFLESNDQPQSIRSLVERSKLEGVTVVVVGTYHRVMPSVGESIIAPCLADIVAIVQKLRTP
jgi:hypothetical protein